MWLPLPSQELDGEREDERCEGRSEQMGSAGTQCSTGLPMALRTLSLRQVMRRSWGAVRPWSLLRASVTSVSASALTFSIDRCHYFHFSLPNLVQVSPVANSNPGPREEGILGNRVLALLSQHSRKHNSLSLVHWPSFESMECLYISLNQL